MAVTHADLEPSRSRREVSTKTAFVFMGFTVLLGLSCFVLCLLAEARRSEVIWMEKGGKSGCVYSGSGKEALLYGACACVGLAIVMIGEHAFLLIAVSKSSPYLLSWDPHSPLAKSLIWQAGFFYVTTWISFGGGEILLLAGVNVESGHLREWSKPRASCVAVREGVFGASGALSLTTVILVCGLSLTALRAQTIISQHSHGPMLKQPKSPVTVQC